MALIRKKLSSGSLSAAGVSLMATLSFSATAQGLVDKNSETVVDERPSKPRVIVDAVMPGLSGYDVCRALREDRDAPRPHVMMLTAGGREADKALAAEVGIDEFVTKPFTPSALRARVREILGDP